MAYGITNTESSTIGAQSIRGISGSMMFPRIRAGVLVNIRPYLGINVTVVRNTSSLALSIRLSQ